MNDKFEAETEKDFNDHVKDAVAEGTARWKAESAAAKQARLSAIREAKAAAAAERDAAREEAARKRAEQRNVIINIFRPLLTSSDLGKYHVTHIF